MKIHIPPIKSQGIKTKLIPWIKSVIPKDFKGVWVEPFMGTGAVGFNVASSGLLCDDNPHLISFYEEIADNLIKAASVRQYLSVEGLKLLETKGGHYYQIRKRFNQYHQPLDFLFLNRSCFNGVMRFNSSGDFNVPFCKRPARFSPVHIRKIANQVEGIRDILRSNEFAFVCRPFENTIASSQPNDIIYCDPPYIGRSTDYYNGWDEEQEYVLYEVLKSAKCRFILSTWHHTPYRENKYIKILWDRFNVHTCDHPYFVGGKSQRRRPVTEALITNF